MAVLDRSLIFYRERIPRAVCGDLVWQLSEDFEITKPAGQKEIP